MRVTKNNHVTYRVTNTNSFKGNSRDSRTGVVQAVPLCSSGVVIMNIKIICVGKLKETYWRDAVSEYGKRLKKFCRLDIVELKESRLAANPSSADEENVRTKESRAILDRIDKGTYVIALEINGKKLTSEAFSRKISDLALESVSDITFVIGGSLGFNEEVSRRANLRLSFSDMTFPHQMMRVILLEQIFRAFKISNNEPYHK